LNRGFDTDKWRIYERKKEPNGTRLVLSIDSKSVTALERVSWWSFSGRNRAVFSLLVVKLERKK
jgi:hypothetical protein